MGQVINFRMDPVWLTIVVSFWSFMLVFLLFYAGPHLFTPIIMGCIAFLSFEILEVLFGTYLTLSDTEFSRTDYFFRKRKISIGDVTGIRYAPTWKLGQQSLRSLVIDGVQDGESKYIDLPNNGFAEKNLAKIATELKRRNPSIKVDEYVNALIKKYAQQP